MMQILTRRFLVGVLSIGCIAGMGTAHAVDLDWKGQFQSEAHFLFNPSLESGEPAIDPTQSAAGGYFIPGVDNLVAFQNVVLRLKPSVIVNDNVYLRSEWWLGDPIFGLFGSGAPYATDQRTWVSNGSRGSLLSVQRVWGEFVTDFGILKVGRLPLNWGLGLTWNAGDKLFDRYLSTGDGVQWTTKFGAFSFTPTIVQYSLGNSISGSCLAGPTGCTAQAGSGSVWEWALALEYQNLDEELDLGLQFQRKMGGSAQDPVGGYVIPFGTGGFAYNTWDIYGRKRWSRVTISAEVPITSGKLGALDYSAIAAATETSWRAFDGFETNLKLGYAPGDAGTTIGVDPTKFTGLTFHPNYRLGLMLFQYQLANFLGPNTLNSSSTGANALRSPYDNPITNSIYGALGAQYELKRWLFRTQWIWASALNSATAGSRYYNTWERRYVAFDPASPRDQGRSLGWEMDYGVQLKWDDAVTASFDMGVYFPGSFYQFTNTATERSLSPMLTGLFRLGVQF